MIRNMRKKIKRKRKGYKKEGMEFGSAVFGSKEIRVKTLKKGLVLRC